MMKDTILETMDKHTYIKTYILPLKQFWMNAL